MKIIKIAEWGKKAKAGDQEEMLRILKFKSPCNFRYKDIFSYLLI